MYDYYSGMTRYKRSSAASHMTRNHIHTITRATAQSRLNQLHTLEHISQQVPTDANVPTLLHAAFGEMEFALDHLAQHRFSTAQDSLNTAQHYTNDIIQRFHAIPPMDITQVRDHNEQLRKDLLYLQPHMTCSDMDDFCQHLHIGPTVQSSCPATCERVRQQQQQHPLAHATREGSGSPDNQMNHHSPLGEARKRHLHVQQHRQKQAQHSDQAGKLQQMLRLVDQEIQDVHRNHAQSKHGVHQRHAVPQDSTNESPGPVQRQCQVHQHTHTFTCDRSDPHCINNSSTLCSLGTIRQRLEDKRRHLRRQIHHLETVGPLL